MINMNYCSSKCCPTLHISNRHSLKLAGKRYLSFSDLSVSSRRTEEVRIYKKNKFSLPTGITNSEEHPTEAHAQLFNSAESKHLNPFREEDQMEKEGKKEAFRKYLESCGVLDALTKVLVGLYEQNEKPSSAIEFIQQKLGGPSISEYEKLQAEMSDMQIKYKELLHTHKETCNELEEVKRSSIIATYTKE